MKNSGPFALWELAATVLLSSPGTSLCESVDVGNSTLMCSSLQVWLMCLRLYREPCVFSFSCVFCLGIEWEHRQKMLRHKAIACQRPHPVEQAARHTPQCERHASFCQQFEMESVFSSFPCFFCRHPRECWWGICWQVHHSRGPHGECHNRTLSNQVVTWTDRWTDRQVDCHTGGWNYRQMDWQTGAHTDWWTNRWINRRMGGCMHEQMDRWQMRLADHTVQGARTAKATFSRKLTKTKKMKNRINVLHRLIYIMYIVINA